MTATRRQFVATVSAVGAAFTVGKHFVLDQVASHAHGTTPIKNLNISPDAGHLAGDMKCCQLLD